MITITIVAQSVSDNTMYLAVDTIHSGYPNRKERMAFSFPIATSVADIETAINLAARKVWIAASNPTWTIAP